MPEMESVVASFKIISCFIVLRHAFKKHETASALNNFSRDVLNFIRDVL
jgi:hypothetical protein